MFQTSRTFGSRILEICGMPLAWHKFRGGFTFEWVGYWLDHAKFCVGIPLKRTCWLIGWIDEVCQPN